MTDEAPPLSRWAAWRQHLRLRKAARLLKRKAISNLDYAVIAADVITRFEKGRPVAVQDHLSMVTYGAHGLFALGIPVKDWETERDRRYGPLGDAPHTLGEHFDAYEGAGDYIERQPMEFVWGAKSMELLWRAEMRLRRRWRLVERYNQWKTRRKEFAPAAHEDWWRVLIWLVGLAAGFVLRGIV
jgi:hypothetical protein